MAVEIRTAHFFAATGDLVYSTGTGIGADEWHQIERNVNAAHLASYYLWDGVALITYPTGGKYAHGFNA
jgi:hypothetical protein